LRPGVQPNEYTQQHSGRESQRLLLCFTLLLRLRSKRKRGVPNSFGGPSRTAARPPFRCRKDARLVLISIPFFARRDDFVGQVARGALRVRSIVSASEPGPVATPWYFPRLRRAFDRAAGFLHLCAHSCERAATRGVTPVRRRTEGRMCGDDLVRRITTSSLVRDLSEPSSASFDPGRG
jgi:hypothetical protein